jgi:hypothetical protein
MRSLLAEDLRAEEEEEPSVADQLGWETQLWDAAAALFTEERAMREAQADSDTQLKCLKEFIP